MTAPNATPKSINNNHNSEDDITRCKPYSGKLSSVGANKLFKKVKRGCKNLPTLTHTNVRICQPSLIQT